MKPICVPCERFYRIKRTGFYFIEGMPTSNDALPGLATPDAWKPYKVWVGDLYECPTCKHQTVAGVPPYRTAEHYEPMFSAAVAKFNATQLIVKDR